MKAERSDRETLFAGHPFALAVVDRVQGIVAAIGEATIRTTKSQVAFRRRRGFAYLWPPEIGNPGVDVVLSIALGRHDPSPRFKQVAHPAPRIVAGGGLRERRVTALTADPENLAFLLDLDRLAIAGVARGSSVGFVETLDPEVDDRADAQELFAAGVAEVLTGVGWHDPVDHAPTPGAETWRSFKTGETGFELGEALVLGGSGNGWIRTSSAGRSP